MTVLDMRDMTTDSAACRECGVVEVTEKREVSLEMCEARILRQISETCVMQLRAGVDGAVGKRLRERVCGVLVTLGSEVGLGGPGDRWTRSCVEMIRDHNGVAERSKGTYQAFCPTLMIKSLWFVISLCC